MVAVVVDGVLVVSTTAGQSKRNMWHMTTDITGYIACVKWPAGLEPGGQAVGCYIPVPGPAFLTSAFGVQCFTLAALPNQQVAATCITQKQEHWLGPYFRGHSSSDALISMCRQGCAIFQNLSLAGLDPAPHSLPVAVSIT